MSERVVRIGRVSTINYEKGCADVWFEDEEDCVRTDLPFFSSEYKMPSVGDMVVVIFRNYGNHEQGIILGAIFNASNAPEYPGKGNYYKKLSDTAYIRYDKESDTLTLAAGKVVIDNQKG